MTKVLLVRPGPSFSVQDVAFGWRDALRELGCIVGDVNLDDRLNFYSSAHTPCVDGGMMQSFGMDDAVRLAADTVLIDCFKFDPQIVLIIMGTFMPLETMQLMRERGYKVALIATESPYEDDRHYKIAHVVDLLILTDPVHVDLLRTVNPNVHYVPHAYDPRRHYPGAGRKELECDFCFVGTGFESRIELFENVEFEGLDVLLGGNWKRLREDSPLRKYVGHNPDWCMGNDEAAELYRSARTSLNLYRREHNDDSTAVGVSLGPREVELAACECWFVRDPRPEGDELFSMLPTFSEAAEIRPLLDWALAHPEERQEAALRAHNAIQDRTFRKNAEWLLQTLNT